MFPYQRFEMGDDKDWCPTTEDVEGLNDKDWCISTKDVETRNYKVWEAVMLPIFYIRINEV